MGRRAKGIDQRRYNGGGKTYRQLPLSEAEELILALLREHSSPEGIAALSLTDICTAVERSKPAVLRALAHLEGRGLLDRERTVGGPHNPTRYRPVPQHANKTRNRAARQVGQGV